MSKHWYNNGQSQRLFNLNQQPEGWVPGMLKSNSNNKGKHFYTNQQGDRILLRDGDEIPEGFKRGFGNYSSQELDNRRKKLKVTLFQKYGIEADNIFQIPQIKEKIKQISFERYGVSNPGNSESAQQKFRQTCLKKYGSKHFAQSECYKNKLASRSEDQIQEISRKQYLTHLKNNSFNISKPEDLYYEYLLSIYDKNDILRQYRSDKYPFSCDFYIKSEDLYIECNYSWTHGPHPFNKDNKEDLQLLKQWEIKSKFSDYYKQAIYTWTDLDVRKQKIAKDNNLNYYVLYN